MKKTCWQLIVGTASCVIFYKLILGFDFTCLEKLSATTLKILFLTSLAFLAAEFIYLKILLKTSLGFTHTKKTLLLFVSSYIVGILTTYYMGLASFIVMLKNIFETTYDRALACSLLELLVRYTLRAVFAAAGIYILAGSKVSTVLLGAVLAALLLRKRLTAGLNKGGRLTGYLESIRESFISLKIRSSALLVFWALAAMIIEAFLFFWILKQMGYSYNFLLILCIRSLGLFSGFISLLPSLNLVEDLSVVSLWLLVGLDRSAAIAAVALSRIFVTIVPLLFSLVIMNIFFKDLLKTFPESSKRT